MLDDEHDEISKATTVKEQAENTVRIGGFELINQRTANSLGVVFEAVDANSGDVVELRTLRGVVDAPILRTALVRRLKLVALLRHSAVLRLRHVDWDADPPFYVVDDPGRRSLQDAGELDSSFAARAPLEIARQIAEGLADAHRMGCVHGHVDADNIWMNDGPKLDLMARFSLAESTIEASDPDPAEDIRGLGRVLYWLTTGKPLPSALSETIAESEQSVTDSSALEGTVAETPADATVHALSLIREMVADDAELRPTARQVADRLTAILGTSAIALEATDAVDVGSVTADYVSGIDSATGHDSDDLAATTNFEPQSLDGPPTQLGRFRIIEELGKGGMGTVYRAEDLADGSIVALKTQHAHIAASPRARGRFLKETRLLARLNNPYVTRLIEVNEDRGILFFALEFVEGESAADHLKQHGAFDEPRALAIFRDVARALIDAHEQGIVHRDVKPENILLVRSESADPSAPHAKLADFGLARQIEQSESLNLTTEGSILGTPLYMSPEQCSGSKEIDARSDVYAMGATLFHLLAGRPPFKANSVTQIIGLHLNEPPPPLVGIDAKLSDRVARIVMKSLAKDPNDRFQNAAEFLEEVDRLVRGESTSIAVHPQLPPAAEQQKFMEFKFSWDLQASPAELWPYASNTDRFNRAMGLPAARFRSEPCPATGGVRRYGETKIASMWIRWEEHPFEWIEGRRFGVLREFSHGPFAWFISTTELSERPTGGTKLTHAFRILPSGWLGRLVTKMQMGRQTQRSLERVYRHIDRIVCDSRAKPRLADAFEDPVKLSASRLRRLDERVAGVVSAGVQPTAIERLQQFLVEAPDLEVDRIRPIALAKRLGLEANELIDACLVCAKHGVLRMLWDVVCPVCRVASEVRNTLKVIEAHAHCEACNLDFDSDFSEAVELIFSVHPEIRSVTTGTYCVGGPGLFPHVVAQSRIRSQERIHWALTLKAGAYRVRSPQLPYVLNLQVDPGGETRQWDCTLGTERPRESPPLRSGRQSISFNNDSPHELQIRIERTVARDDALTAARAASLARFREMFPGEVLTLGQLANVARVTFLAVELGAVDELYASRGDGETFAVIHDCLRLIDDRVREAGGAVVKIVGNGVLASFNDPADALALSLSLPDVFRKSKSTAGLPPRIAIHCGDAMLTTMNDRLDYFGQSVNTVFRALERAGDWELLLTQSVADDPVVADRLESDPHPLELVGRTGAGGEVLHRIHFGPT
ncbi:MAG: protein kinase [Planctomycetota bacterium]|nr:protein kinase [Planctomycetota bacterium]